MRIVFIGTVEFSRRALAQVLDSGGQVVGVATKEASAFNSDFADLAPLCRGRGIPILHAGDINAPDSVAWIRDKRPDVIFCFGWSHLIKTELLGMPRLGVVGYHPAALPANRGRHPLIWTLALGLERSASTFFFMDQGADTGDILSQVPFEVGERDTAATLYETMCRVATAQIADFLPRLADGTYRRIPQPSAGNVWRKRGPRDGAIDFRMGSRSICNLVRALTRPYVGAHIAWQQEDIKVWQAEVSSAASDRNLEPGKVLAVSGRVFTVKTGDGAVDILDHGFASPPPEGSYL